MSEKVQVSIKEIYRLMCPECREKMRDLVKEKMADQMLDRTLGGQSPQEEHGADHG